MPTGQDLTRFPLLHSLSSASLETLAALTTERRYDQGQMIALEGDPCHEVRLVAEGLVRLRQQTLEGREYVLSYVGPGGYFDLIPALDGGPVGASADALIETAIYCVNCADWQDLLGTEAGLARSVAEHLARDVRRLSRMVKDLALYPVRARLARFLLNHAEASPAVHRWTQDMIAAQIGTVRDVVGRLLRAFEQEGLVARERGRLVVADREAMEREAQNG